MISGIVDQQMGFFMADIISKGAGDQIDSGHNRFAEATLDLVHLSRQTMGDAKLEQEILVLFLIQCESCEKALLLPSKPGILTEIAHQMKGCAKAVGAWDIAQTAGLLEKNPDKENLVSKLQDQIHLVKKYLGFLTKSEEISEILH
jgi:HPt (histidine-containing phosphotransfer) domain-containing protein